jgi:apolipoprotein N-acyltransferase
MSKTHHTTPTPGSPHGPRDAAGLPRLWREAGLVLGLYLVTAIALAWIFPPRGLWPLVFVALVPWAVATCRTHRAWLAHWLSFLVGWGFFLVTLRWLMPVTGLGYGALAGYLALYWTVAAWAIRTGRRHGVSPVWTLPVTWVACEYLRGTVMTGFPWLFLSHSLYSQLPLIQVSDLAGAYGVSFLAAWINGVLVEAALRRWPAPGRQYGGRQLWAGAAVGVALLAGTCGYGLYRLREVDFEATSALHGPRVAVVQHDFPLVSTWPYGDDPSVVLVEYLRLAADAARQQPDLLAFPETVWAAYQNIDFVERGVVVPEVQPGSWAWGVTCHRALSAFARGDYSAVNAIISNLERDLRKLGAARPEMNVPKALPRLPAEGGPRVTALVGAVSLDQFPEATYPKVRYYNSALLYDADGNQRRQRYDKNHLVPFGELVPFRQAKLLGFDLHWLYRWLNKLSPFSRGGQVEYSLTPGAELTVFELATPTGDYRFGVPICYEDATPHVIRRFVWEGRRRRVDFLVNISNDGWFLHSHELPQHLAICVFRAVENRVGIARAVNTGISAFIDPNGRIYSRVRTDGRDFGPGVVGYDVQRVYLDRRGSFYGRAGDWLALACLGLAGILWLGAVFERWILALRHRILLLLRRGGP